MQLGTNFLQRIVFKSWTNFFFNVFEGNREQRNSEEAEDQDPEEVNWGKWAEPWDDLSPWYKGYTEEV